MAISSKEIVLFSLGIVGSLLLGLYLRGKVFTLNNLQSKDIVIILGLAIIFTIIIFYKKFKEVDNELENQKINQKRLDEKLIIYDRLAKVEEKVGI